MSSEIRPKTDRETVSRPAAKLTFSAAQQKVIDSRDHNLLVSASAGAGKTAVLVERLCQLVIKDRVPISSILAMTFTEDAAREMKSRLKQRLSELPRDPWIDLQIAQLETASISTIHSFCLDVVQRYYYLADLSYAMVSHVDNGLADAQALETACRNALASLAPQKSASLQLYLEAYSKKDRDLQEMLLKFLDLARSKPDWKEWVSSCAAPSEAIADMFYSWYAMRIQALIDIFEQVLDEVELMEFARADRKKEYLVLFEGKLRALQSCLQALADHQYRAFGRQFVEYIETTGKFTPTINKVSFREIQADSRKLEKQIADCLFTPEQFEEASRQTADVQKTFVEAAIRLQEEFLRLKKEAGFIDFSDMEQYAWQILQNPQAAGELRTQYSVILIDEYQDTNDLQESIIRSIARKNNVFRVGDIKQSIYRFRQARPELMKFHLEHAGPDDEVVAMQENYRSSETLIDFCNVFFERLMNTPGLPPQFSAIDRARPGTDAQKDGEQKPVRFLFTEYGNMADPKSGEKLGDLKARAVHRQHRYDLIAHDIVQKVEAGEIQLRDVAILTRSSTPHDELRQALDAWGIRAIHHIRKGFYTNKAIQIVLSAMRVIQDPRNDIALMAALCSPLTGLSQRQILPLLAGREPGQSLYNTLQSSPEGYQYLKLARELQTLKGLPLAQIVIRIFAIRQFYDLQTTAQDKTNLDLLLQKAVEAQGLLDLDGFLDSATLEENLDKTSEAIPFGREEDAVRISTIHASKGLQYKLVYLLSDQNQRDMESSQPITFDADLGLSFNGLDVASHLKVRSAPDLALAHKRFLEDTEEKMRLLYVACTRAEQELVFVDTLKSEEMYDAQMNVQALLSHKGFTSWFFHTFHAHPQAGVVFEKVETLYERPDGSALSRNQRYPIRRYSLPETVITSKTASQSKKTLSWKQIRTPGIASSLEARERGTLIHEIVAALPYPYRREDIEAYARQADMPLDTRSVEQILALNGSPLYQQFMKAPHQFECAYCTKEEDAYVHGFMDLVVELPEGPAVIDFKTDSAFDAASLVSRYRDQLETYRRALEQICPGRSVKAWIYSFALEEMIEV